eukprot:8203752-Pyramimonas_sp.AAC.1
MWGEDQSREGRENIPHLRGGDQSREGREHIPTGATSHVREERIYLASSSRWRLLRRCPGAMGHTLRWLTYKLNQRSVCCARRRTSSCRSISTWSERWCA